MGLSAPNLFPVHGKCLEASEVCWSKLFAFCWFMALFGVLWLFYICSITLFSTSAKWMLHDFGRSLLPSTFKFLWLFMDLVSSGPSSKDPITFANVKKHQEQLTQFSSHSFLFHPSFFSTLSFLVFFFLSSKELRADIFGLFLFYVPMFDLSPLNVIETLSVRTLTFCSRETCISKLLSFLPSARSS